MEEPEPQSFPVPAPESAPVVIQVSDQQVPPPQVLSDYRDLSLMVPTVVPVPEDYLPWASVISRNENDNHEEVLGDAR